MTKTISKAGNSQGIIFDAALMDLALVKVGDQVRNTDDIRLRRIVPSVGSAPEAAQSLVPPTSQSPAVSVESVTATLRLACLRAPQTRNAKAIENDSGRVGAVEGVEVNPGDVVIQKIVALFQSEVNADAANHFTIVFAAL